MSTPRTVIIGAGIIGLLCGYELRKKGASVIILDKGEPAAGCSARNAGWIVPSFSQPLPSPGLIWSSFKWMLRRDSPLYISPRTLLPQSAWLLRFWRHCSKRNYRKGIEALAAFNKGTMASFDSLKREGFNFQLHESGLLFVFLSRTAMRKTLAEFEPLQNHGLQPPKILTHDELHDFEPELSDEVSDGFWIRGERHVSPEEFNKELIARLLEMGVVIRPGVAVRGGIRADRTLRAIRTDDGLIKGDQFLIAAGSWSGLLARDFDIRLPIQAGKGYSITVDRPRRQVKGPIYLCEAKTACTPLNRKLRIAGTMELSGINSVLDPRRVATIRRAAKRYLKDFASGGEQMEWVGLRPITPDGLPIIGRLRGYNNLFMATGHGMLGLTLAPVTARAITEVMYSGRTDIDLSPFDPARFRC